MMRGIVITIFVALSGSSMLLSYARAALTRLHSPLLGDILLGDGTSHKD